MSLLKDFPKPGALQGALRYAKTFPLFHKVTSRASAPQNTLWETLKLVQVESILVKKTVTLLGEQDWG